MRRGAELEGVDDESELVVGLLRADAEHFEHPLLHVGLVDTDAAAAELCAVQHEIVGIGADSLEVFLLVGVKPLDMLRLRSGEGVVHRVETLGLVVPLEQREVDNPQRSEDLGVAEAEAVTHLYTQHAEHGLGLALCSAEHEHEVSGLCASFSSDGFDLVFCIEFVDGRFDCAVFIHLYIYEALGSNLRTLYPLGELIGLLAGVAGCAGNCDGADIFNAVEH